MKFEIIAESSRNSTTNAAIEVMRNNLDYEDGPEVGLFWYDPKGKELYGVVSVPANDVQYYHSSQWQTDIRTCSKGYESVWKKEYYRGKDNRFTGDYKQRPRGRVFEFKDNGFKVMTGNWINDYPEAAEIIVNEFNLPEDTQFVIDRHWDLGHGWSQEF